MGLHPAGALALRRFVIAMVAVFVTMGAHLAAAGHGLPSVDLPVATMTVGTVGIAALLIGRRAGPFRPRGPVVTLAILLAFQVVAHLAMWAAPWIVGLDMHHQGALITPTMVLMHAAATVVLLPIVVGMERILAAAVNAVRRLRRLLTGRHVGSAWVEVLWVSDGRRISAPVVWHASARGPPAGATPG